MTRLAQNRVAPTPCDPASSSRMMFGPDDGLAHCPKAAVGPASANKTSQSRQVLPWSHSYGRSSATLDSVPTATNPTAPAARNSRRMPQFWSVRSTFTAAPFDPRRATQVAAAATPTTRITTRTQ